MSEKISRKDFLKLAGLGAAAFPVAKVVGRLGNFELVESNKMYGGFTIKRLAKGEFPHEIKDDYERFDYYNQMFGRGRWDEEYIADRKTVDPDIAKNKMAAGEPGYQEIDSALKNASWWLARNRGAGSYDWVTDPEKVGTPKIEGMYTPEKLTNILKTAALFLGASTVGVAETDERWFYKTLGSTPDVTQNLVFGDVDVPVKPEEGDIIIPKKMNRVIAMTVEMDYDAFLPNGISLLVGGATGQGYTKMALTAPSLATFIRSLGWQAIPMGNDTGLSVPIAISAGLGEQGRLGFLVTPKYGPRVRLLKVLTDMPLEVDTPISFGVKEFCENCELCAKYCPSNSIQHGDNYNFDAYDINNNPGVEKWQVSQRSCHKYWLESGAGCINCAAVCPFNKPEGWLHEATRIMIGAKIGPLNNLMKNLDEISGYGGTEEAADQKAYDEFWNNKINKDFIHIKNS